MRSVRKHKTTAGTFLMPYNDGSSSKGNLSARRSPDGSIHKKTTKILGGHAMSIRDLTKSKLGRLHKLNDRGITGKEFG